MGKQLHGFDIKNSISLIPQKHLEYVCLITIYKNIFISNWKERNISKSNSVKITVEKIVHLCCKTELKKNKKSIYMYFL